MPRAADQQCALQFEHAQQFPITQQLTGFASCRSLGRGILMWHYTVATHRVFATAIAATNLHGGN